VCYYNYGKYKEREAQEAQRARGGGEGSGVNLKDIGKEKKTPNSEANA